MAEEFRLGGCDIGRGIPPPDVQLDEYGFQ